MDDELTLLSVSRSRGTDGVWRGDTTRRTVFCKIDSITRQEFFQAGRNGLNPEFRATVFAADYHGERVCVLHDKSYAIYRTYHVPGTDYIELYVQREGGTNGKEGNDEEGNA